MGFPTKVQLIQRQASEQWYINFPSAVAQALEFEKGEVVEWIIKDKTTLILRRQLAPPAVVRIKKRPPNAAPERTRSSVGADRDPTGRPAAATATRSQPAGLPRTAYDYRLDYHRRPTVRGLERGVSHVLTPTGESRQPLSRRPAGRPGGGGRPAGLQIVPRGTESLVTSSTGRSGRCTAGR